MSERFTETQMLKLAEIYRDYVCLYDVNNDLYKDRAARDAAYQKILDRLEIPGLSVKDIPKKIKNLRSSYYQELKRIQKSKRLCAGEDAVYKPKVSWFPTVERYLKPFERLHALSSRSCPNELQAYSCNDKDSNDAEEAEASDSEFETQNTKIEDFIINEEDLKHAEEEESNETLHTYFILPSNKQNIKRKLDTVDADIHSAIAKIDKIADRLTQNASSLRDRREDEFDTFGKYIATTLRTLPKELAIVGRTDIQKVISEMQLRALRQDSDSRLPYSTIKLEHE